MKVKQILSLGIIAFILHSCSADRSKPKDVVQQYIELGFDRNYPERYELLSNNTKQSVSLGEYQKFYEAPDSLLFTNHKILSLEELNSDANYPTYKRFKTKIQQQNSKNDTLVYLNYWSLKNDDNKWGVVWSLTIQLQANQKFNDSEYEGALQLLKKANELDPFDAGIYSLTGWCFVRDDSKNLSERKDNILKNFKYAISLEPDMANHYNSLASYYSVAGIPDLQIENYNKAIDLTLNESEKGYLFANLSGVYLNENKIKESVKSIEKAIEIDKQSAFNWYKYGLILMEQDKNDQAKVAFEKSLNLPEMANSLQSSLYYNYSDLCYQLKDYKTSKKYILMCLELDPNASWAISLYEKLKLKS